MAKTKVSTSKKSSAEIFAKTLKKIHETPVGREAAMYGPIRDLISDIWGWDRESIDIDIIGEGGRPDITVWADSGFKDGNGKPRLMPWIVGEAKDEPDAFTALENRAAIFREKSKYVREGTAWFLMIDPKVFIARSVRSQGINTGPEADIVLPLDGSAGLDVFISKLAPMHASQAGIPETLRRFRAGDTDLIASKKLTVADDATEAQIKAARAKQKLFFHELEDTAAYLQWACSAALERLQPTLTNIRLKVDEFEKKYGELTFTANPLTVFGHPKSFELAKQHRTDAATLKRYLSQHLGAARLELEYLRGFSDRTGVEKSVLLDLFATETANLVLARTLLLRFLEDHGFFGRHYLCNGGVEAFQRMRDHFEEPYTRLLEEA